MKFSRHQAIREVLLESQDGNPMRQLFCDVLWWIFTALVGVMWFALLVYWLYLYA